MPADNPDHGDVIAYVARYLPCHACGAAFGPDDVRVVLHDGAEWTYTATCPACHAEQAVTVYDQPPYTSLQAAIPAVITPAEVAGWAAFLAAFRGDIRDLLASG